MLIPSIYRSASNMWGLFSRSESKESQLEARVSGYYSRLTSFISAAIETASMRKSDPQLINSPELCEPFNSLLAAILTEDQGETSGLEFGPGLSWVLGTGCFDQLVAWGQLDQPTGLFAKVVYFFTLLVMDVRNQPLMQHQAFNRALLNLLFMTNERIKRGQVFSEAEITAVPLIHAISTRITQEPSLASCFLAKEETGSQYVLLPVLEYYIKGERTEEGMVLECVTMLGQVEDQEVVDYVLTQSELLQLVARRMVKSVANLPHIWGKTTIQRPKELEEVCKYLSHLDNFCRLCLHSSLTNVLTSALLSDCLQPYISPYISSPDLEIRSAFTRYFLHMVWSVSSPDLLLCLARVLHSSPAHLSATDHHRFESCSTMISSNKQVPDLLKPPPKAISSNTWQGFIDNLRSGQAVLRLSSLKLLYAFLTKGGLEMIKLIVCDAFVGETPVGFSGCSYERFMSNFPASLLHSDVKSTVSYYYESLGKVFTSALPQLEHFSCPSFMTRRVSIQSFEPEAVVFRPQDLYGSQSSEESTVEMDKGPVMDYLLDKIEGMLTNSPEENLLVTGILSALCRIPALNMQSSILFFLLFSMAESNALMSRLRKVAATQIDNKIMAMAVDVSNFESALYGARKALGIEVDPGLPADRNYMELHLKEGSQLATSRKVRDSHLIEVRARQGVVLYQEFVRELAGCVLAQQQICIVRDCGQEAVCM